MIKKTKETLLTETELELMNILWGLESSTVREILDKLPENRKMAYTSASTIIRILEQKGIVESSKVGKAHLYSPILTKKVYESSTLSHVIKNVFNGAPSDLVKTLVKGSSLSAQEKAEIKRLIDEEF